MSDLCEDRFIDEERVCQAQTQMIDGFSAVRLSEVFKALSDPSRVRIISALMHTELCVYDLAAVLDMREMRLVRYRREGRHIYYQLDDEHIRDLFRRGLEHIEHD
jgi:ArsR family transcriptional regulator